MLVHLPGEKDSCLSVCVVGLKSIKHILEILRTGQLWEA